MWLCLVNSDMQRTNIMRIYQYLIQLERCITIRIPKSKKVPALIKTEHCKWDE
jgi:hypothetical protein